MGCHLSLLSQSRPQIAPQDTSNLEDSHTEETRVKTLPNYHVFEVKTSVIHIHMFQNGHIVKNLTTPGPTLQLSALLDTGV